MSANKQNLPLDVEFAASYLDGVMTGEPEEIRSKWSKIRKYLAQLPVPDQDKSEPTRESACVALLEAAHAFWKSEKRHGAYGAVKFAEFESGELVIFTRGEYREKLMAAVGGIEDGPHYFHLFEQTANSGKPS